MTEYLEHEGGRLAYEVSGEGPLVVLSPGMGDLRTTYRFLAPRLVEAGYRVAAMDLRGHGESSVGWSSYTRTDTAGDLLALIRHLGGPAVIMGHSFSGGSATIAAAREPGLVSAIVEFDPFTRAQRVDLGALVRVARYRRGMALLMGAGMFGSLRLWIRYLDGVAFPHTRPADHAEQLTAIEARLREPGRMAALVRMGRSQPTDAGAQLGEVRCPALIVNGAEDPDFPDPRAEAEGIVAAMPAGLGRVAMIDGAGHYPHAQSPHAVLAVVLPFLKENVRA